MKKSIVAVMLCCAAAGPVLADGLAASMGVDTLSYAGIHASVPTLGIATATHVHGVGISVAERFGHGDGTTLEIGSLDISAPGTRIGVVSVVPTVRVAALSAVGPAITGVSTGYATIGAQVSVPLASRITAQVRGDVGATFLGGAVTPAGTASGSGTVRSLGAALAYHLSAHRILAASYTYRRLPIGTAAMVDHHAQAAFIYRF